MFGPSPGFSCILMATYFSSFNTIPGIKFSSLFNQNSKKMAAQRWSSPKKTKLLEPQLIKSFVTLILFWKTCPLLAIRSPLLAITVSYNDRSACGNSFFIASSFLIQVILSFGFTGYSWENKKNILNRSFRYLTSMSSNQPILFPAKRRYSVLWDMLWYHLECSRVKNQQKSDQSNCTWCDKEISARILVFCLPSNACIISSAGGFGLSNLSFINSQNFNSVPVASYLHSFWV